MFSVLVLPTYILHCLVRMFIKKVLGKEMK